LISLSNKIDFYRAQSYYKKMQRVSVALTWESDVGFTMTDEEFHEHLANHFDDYSIIELTTEPVYDVQLDGATLSFSTERGVPIFTSLADGSWESCNSNFWKVMDGDEELALIDATVTIV